MKHLFLCVLALFSISSTAGAQNFEPKGFVAGVGGGTFGTETGGIFGASVGGYATPRLQIFGEVGRMTNVLPKSVQADVDDAASLLSFYTGERWDFNAKAPATYFGGGVKVLLSQSAGARPYVTGGGGMANIKTSIKEIDFGEVTDDLVEQGLLDESDLKTTKAYMSAGGGVIVSVGRMYVDLGYRFNRIFVVDSNVSRVYAAFGVNF
jgi:hypothetical protein